MRYRYKMYRISWGGIGASWEEFITYALQHFGRTWMGNGVVTFTASPQELREAAQRFGVDAHSFSLATDMQFLPETES